jgi:hypothetical protein
MRAKISWIIAGAMVALALFAGLDAIRSLGDDPPPAEASQTEPATTTQAATDAEEIERKAGAWANFFASPPYGQACVLMTQPLCERIAACDRAGRTRSEICAGAFWRSFEDARVVDIVIKGHRAAARFSNGEVVRFSGDERTWLAHKVGENAGRGFFE